VCLLWRIEKGDEDEVEEKHETELARRWKDEG
jgi:hypothetical protein